MAHTAYMKGSKKLKKKKSGKIIIQKLDTRLTFLVFCYSSPLVLFKVPQFRVPTYTGQGILQFIFTKL